MRMIFNGCLLLRSKSPQQVRGRSPTIMLQLSGSPHSRIDLSQSLTELLCDETPDALQPKAEYDAVLVTSADVKGVVLDRHAAAIAGVAERVERRAQRREPGGPAVLKI